MAGIRQAKCDAMFASIVDGNEFQRDVLLPALNADDTLIYFGKKLASGRANVDEHKVLRNLIRRRLENYHGLLPDLHDEAEERVREWGIVAFLTSTQVGEAADGQ